MQRSYIGNMNVEQNLSCRSPVVYTKRLEDMAILRKELSEITFDDLIELIIAESKPCYRNDRNMSSNSIFSGSKRMYFKRLKLERKLNNYTRIKKKILLYDPDKGECHREQYTSKNSSHLMENELNMAIKSENEPNESKLKSLLAMCKPLRIVLEDISKKIPRQIHDEGKMEVVSLLSSEDEEITIQPKRLSTDAHDTKLRLTSTDVEENISLFLTIRNTEDYISFLKNHDLRNSVVVFYNEYVKELDAYEIDEMYVVVDCVNAKYSRVYKFKTRKRNSVFNIVVCCWKQRRHYISLLHAIEKYRAIAKFMYRRHSCQVVCVCCCFNTCTNDNDDNLAQLEADIFKNVGDVLKGKNSNTLSDTKHITSDVSNSSCKKTSVLISNALAYKKDSKWKGNERKENSTQKTKCSNELVYNTLIKLCNINGTIELYELENLDQIYSKLIITHYNHHSVWLLKTMGLPRAHITRTFNDPLERESQINLFKNSMNISVYNYLRNPTKKNNVAYEHKDKLQKYKGINYTYSSGVEHNRSFMGARNNKWKTVLSILPQKFAPKTPVRTNNVQIRHYVESAPIKDVERTFTPGTSSQMDNQQIGKYITPDISVQADNQHTGQYLTIGPIENIEKMNTPELSDEVDNPQIGQNIATTSTNNVDINVSHSINSLIKNILYRFRDINLTINSQGKVSASLNAPLGSLSFSELKMLSDILKRAQSQVDELGLTPEKLLNADTQKLLQSTSSNSPTNAGTKQVLNNNPVTINIPDETNTYTAHHQTTNVITNYNQPTSKPDVNSNPKIRNIPGGAYIYDITKCKDLSRFSKWISEKKTWYGNAFRSFLYDTTEVNTGDTPKIVDVFSLNTEVKQDSCTLPEMTKDLLVGLGSNEKIDNSTVKVETKTENDSSMTLSSCLSEIQQQISLLDDYVNSTVQKGQKRKIASLNDVNSIIKNRKVEGKEAADNAAL